MVARAHTVYVTLGREPFRGFRDLDVWCESHDCQGLEWSIPRLLVRSLGCFIRFASVSKSGCQRQEVSTTAQAPQIRQRWTVAAHTRTAPA